VAGSAAPPFITTDLDLAAYLKTIGRRLIGTQPQGRFVTFHFEPSAGTAAQMYLTIRSDVRLIAATNGQLTTGWADLFGSPESSRSR